MEPCDALETLRTFRDSLYECFDRRSDALFELTEGPSSQPTSSPHRSTGASRVCTAVAGVASTPP